MEFTREGLAKAAHLARVAAAVRGKADAKYHNLKEVDDTFLAALMNDLDDGDSTDTKLRRLARASEEYKTFKKGLCAARTEYRQAEAESIAADRDWKTVQSGMKERVSELERISGA